MSNRSAEFKNQLQQLEINVNNNQIQQFMNFYEYLIEWNKKMNLTGITEYEEVISKHFIDSLAIVKVMQLDKKISVIDIGTGAGFPGIPLKIAFPGLDIVLLDSLKKRVTFLDYVIDNLGLEGIRAVHGRAEDLAREDEYREFFDLAVSRAVAHLSVLSEYTLPFVKTKGCFVSYKGSGVADELKEAEKAVGILGGSIKENCSFVLPGTDMGRTFVVVEKCRKTSNKYPRKAGVPGKEPL